MLGSPRDKAAYCKEMPCPAITIMTMQQTTGFAREAARHHSICPQGISLCGKHADIASKLLPTCRPLMVTLNGESIELANEDSKPVKSHH